MRKGGDVSYAGKPREDPPASAVRLPPRRPDGAVRGRAALIGFALTILVGVFGGVACTAHHRPPTWQGEIPSAALLAPEDEAHAAELLADLRDEHAEITEGAVYDRVWPVFASLLATAGLEPGQWEIHVLDTPEIADVRAVPGQRLFLWSGMMDLLEGDDELAGLLALEIAHSLARHTAPVAFHPATELLFSVTDIATTLGLAVLSQGMLAVSMPGMTRHAYVEAANLDPLDRQYTLDQESETVFVALAILERSDYCPAALKRFWERIERHPEIHAKAERLLRGIPAEERIALLNQELTVRQARRSAMSMPKVDVEGNAAARRPATAAPAAAPPTMLE